MSITNNGMHIATASHDRTIRLWERTEEPLILDEEKEEVRYLSDQENIFSESDRFFSFNVKGT